MTDFAAMAAELDVSEEKVALYESGQEEIPVSYLSHVAINESHSQDATYCIFHGLSIKLNNYVSPIPIEDRKSVV